MVVNKAEDKVPKNMYVDTKYMNEHGSKGILGWLQVIMEQVYFTNKHGIGIPYIYSDSEDNQLKDRRTFPYYFREG